ncbi:MAG: MmgE/PrpD family protein [Hyphomicrobiales bacterium]|nr:MmgE/PrpD family protein [Hyphomicrobiales bacterium]
MPGKSSIISKGPISRNSGTPTASARTKQWSRSGSNSRDAGMRRPRYMSGLGATAPIESRMRTCTRSSAISMRSRAGDELAAVDAVPWRHENRHLFAQRVRAKVHLVPDEALSKLLPTRVTVVEIELADGRCLSERVSAVRGTPRNPMSRGEVTDKAHDLTAPLIGPERAGRLIESVYAIETMPDVRALRTLLQSG